MLTTTLNKILQASPGISCWSKLTGQSRDPRAWHGDDEPLTILSILESNDMFDAMWVCEHAHDKARFEQWLNYMAGHSISWPATAEHTGRLCTLRINYESVYFDVDLLAYELVKYLKGDDSTKQNPTGQPMRLQLAQANRSVAELEGKGTSDTHKSTQVEMLRVLRLAWDAQGIENIKKCDTYGVYFPHKFSGEEILLYMPEIRSQEPEDYGQLMWMLRHHSGKTLAQLETFDLIIISKSFNNRL